MIAIVDYGMGNLGSIRNMLCKIGETDVVITADKSLILRANGIILPGVGAYDMGVSALRSDGLFETIKEAVLVQRKPILGICLGMQLLGKRSEEGELSGLGLIDFECIKFSFPNNELRVPHMGWNYVTVENSCQLSHNLIDDSRFYFVHSYKAICKDENDVFMSCVYGDKFTAAVHRDNIYGVQFHPEKSHKYGMSLMKNFAEICRNV